MPVEIMWIKPDATDLTFDSNQAIFVFPFHNGFATCRNDGI